MGDAASPRASSSGAPSGTTRRVKAPQVPILTAAYQRNPYPSAVEKKALCDALNLSLRYVDVSCHLFRLSVLGFTRSLKRHNEPAEGIDPLNGRRS